VSKPHLIIGNKNYSSWSFRPWIAMAEGGIAFDETLVPFNDDAGNPEFLKYSPAGRVPVLKHGDLTLWESLAILEYLAETFPDAQLWPQDAGKRAMARVVANEMHAGFGALRARCPMNMRRPVAGIGDNPAVAKDVGRIVELWRDALAASGGPFLFGAFSNADAMYAPVVNRLHVYDLTDDSTARGYMDQMMSLKTWKDWEEAGRNEPWVVPADEA
jgi:glutathione S-transferase